MHTANYYEQRNEIILFGGYSEGSLLNKIFRFNLRNNDIKAQKVQDEENMPEPRIGHAAFIFQDFLYIFGGSIQDGNLLNDLWKLDLNNFSWEKILENNKFNENDLFVCFQVMIILFIFSEEKLVIFRKVMIYGNMI